MAPCSLTLKRSSNGSSIKTRFAYRFLRGFKRLNKDKPINSNTSSCAIEIYNRYRLIKFAANASMASAVGSRRVWSRAVLRRIRFRVSVRGRRRSGALLRRRERLGRANKLRKLVPGGEAMDMLSLLAETAHYIKCLTTQVQVMRNIVDCYST
ncbi:transcription factor IBH1-like [Cornus florida]|uniref:transcription factor IBH1-like n=1 Tax=Cornus florida TaxID=4283 RepID=UPI0028A11A50|nr:transcription factor IBH1-like [Cornus florida]